MHQVTDAMPLATPPYWHSAQVPAPSMLRKAQCVTSCGPSGAQYASRIATHTETNSGPNSSSGPPAKMVLMMAVISACISGDGTFPGPALRCRASIAAMRCSSVGISYPSQHPTDRPASRRVVFGQGVQAVRFMFGEPPNMAGHLFPHTRHERDASFSLVTELERLDTPFKIAAHVWFSIAVKRRSSSVISNILRSSPRTYTNRAPSCVGTHPPLMSR